MVIPEHEGFAVSPLEEGVHQCCITIAFWLGNLGPIILSVITSFAKKRSESITIDREMTSNYKLFAPKAHLHSSAKDGLGVPGFSYVRGNADFGIFEIF